MIKVLKQINRKVRAWGREILKLFNAPKRDFAEYEKAMLHVEGCTDTSLKEQYALGNIAEITVPMQKHCDALFELIVDKVKSKTPYTIIRASDGEAFFLNKQLKGNGPTRHFTADEALTDEKIAPFREGFLKCDSRHIEMYRNLQSKFQKIYGRNVFSKIPFECLYALIANRKLLKLPYRIGLIGADNKMEIIRRMMEFPQYQEYVGRNAFQDYISVPERGTSNDPEGLLKQIQSNLKPDIDIYLVGIGIAKLAVMHRFTEASNAVFIDVGAGISALAGCVSDGRPYYADWINYRLADFDYSKIDIMDSELKDKRAVVLG